jgi:hypothetical protein
MERGSGRSSDERAAAREARDRARIAREQGVSTEEEQAALREEEPPSGWDGPELDEMSRYGGGSRLSSIDIYTRRRIVALLVIVGLIVILFLMLGGC